MEENPSADEPAAPNEPESVKNDSESTLAAEAEQHGADAAAELAPALSPAVEASGSKSGSTRVSIAGAEAHPAEATAAAETHDTADATPAAAADAAAEGDKAEAAAPESAEHNPDSSSEAAAAAASAAEVAAEGSHAAPPGAEASKQCSNSTSSGDSPSSSSSSTEESQAKRKPEKAAKKSDAGSTAAAAAATVHAAPKVPAAKTHVEPEPAEEPTKVASPRHKETAAERLTTPTAMRMLKTLEHTQGGKAEWHIATGVPFKSKKLAPDEMAAMVDRLCTPKHAEDNMPPKPHAVKLVFEGTKEVLVPVKETSKDDNIAYMSSLYERCQKTRAKTMQTLQEKWLQPLNKPKQAAK